MYRWEKSLRDLEKSRKNPMSPSFSSSLLDEIYRSIDGKDEGERSVNNNNNNSSNNSKYMINNCRSGSNGGAGVQHRTKVEGTSSSLIDKWMDKKVSAEKVMSSSRRRPCSLSSSLPEIDNGYIMKSSSSMLLHDNDPIFFSSSSISSDSSSGGLSSSSSDTEFFSSSTSLRSNKTSRKSCFTTAAAAAAPWPKPVRTSVSRLEKPSGYEFHTFDDHQNSRQKTKDQETLFKSKNRAMKIYANLKNVKQPISPGARLTSFINSLFTNGNTKKSNDKNRTTNSKTGYEDLHSERKSKSTQASSTSYSNSSFSKSRLSNTPPPPPPPPPAAAEKSTDSTSGSGNTTTKRTVRFYPVSVIVGEDCRPCGQKCIYDPTEEFNKREQKPIQIQNSSKNRNGESNTFTVKRIISRPEEEEDYDDCGSDSSSDLFEIDHLSLFNNIHRFREELPVYKTTHLDRNLAIASGLIR